MSNEAKNTPQEPKKPSNQKPVFFYILILCIAAFLLMALSFAMHQRSNREALGQLQTSFNATIEEIQETQEQILALEQELDSAKDQLAAAQQDIADGDAALAAAQREAEAMEALYVLQQKYSAGLYQECLTLAEQMEADGLVSLLSPIPITSEVGGTVTAPYTRYLQFREAAAQKLAYNAEN